MQQAAIDGGALHRVVRVQLARPGRRGRAASTPQLVAAHVARDHEQVGDRVAVEALQSRRDARERLLHRVLGVAAVVQHRRAHGQDARALLFVQRGRTTPLRVAHLPFLPPLRHQP